MDIADDGVVGGVMRTLKPGPFLALGFQCLIPIRTKSVTDSAPCLRTTQEPGQTVVYTTRLAVLAALQKLGTGRRCRFSSRGAPDSDRTRRRTTVVDRTGLADLPEDRPAADLPAIFAPDPLTLLYCSRAGQNHLSD